MILLLACAAPEAPAELDELTVYLYENHADDEAMAVGVESLATWLEANSDLEPDYGVSPLSAESVDTLDEVDRSVEGLIGLAVVTPSVHTVEDAGFAMVGADLLDVYPDMFVEHSVDWVGDRACWLDGECARLEGQEDYQSQFAFGIESHARPYNEYLWLDTDVGKAMVQRNWMTEPPEVNSALLEVEEQYYLNLFVESSDGGWWRLQSTWMVYNNNGVDEDLALGATGNSMRDNSEALDAFLDES